MDRNEIEDMLDKEFDPKDLENIDEDALLGDSALATTASFVSYEDSKLTEGNEAQLSVSSTYFADVVDSNTSTAEQLDTNEHEILAIKSEVLLDAVETTKGHSTNLDESEDEEDEDSCQKSPIRNKFKSEKIVLRPAVDRSNIPDSLDDVKVLGVIPKVNQRYNAKFFNKKSTGRNTAARARTVVQSMGRVLFNPHFKGIVQSDANVKLVRARGIQNGANTTRLVCSHVAFPSTTMPPPLLARGPPPPLIIPPRGVPLGQIVPPMSISHPSNISAGLLPVSSFAPALKPNAVDLTKPPPLPASTPVELIIADKEVWYGRTEDFLKKLQCKESPDSTTVPSRRQRRGVVHRHGENHAHKTRPHESYHSSNRRRRSNTSSSSSSSSSSPTDSSADDLSPKREKADLMRSQISQKSRSAESSKVDRSIFGDEYLNKLEEQKRKRDEFVKLKELRRVQEMTKKQGVDFETTMASSRQTSSYSTNAETPLVTMTSTESKIAARIRDSIKQRTVVHIVRGSGEALTQMQSPISVNSSKKFTDSPIKKSDSVRLSPKTSAGRQLQIKHQRRVVLPPLSRKMIDNVKASNEQKAQRDKVVLKFKESKNITNIDDKEKIDSKRKVPVKQRLQLAGVKRKRAGSAGPAKKAQRFTVAKNSNDSIRATLKGQKLELWTNKSKNRK